MLGGSGDGLRQDGGVKGGDIVSQGTPEVVAKAKGSFTGKYLAPLLKPRKVAEAAE